MNINDRIKYLRIKNSLTQKELGVKINVSEVSIRGWETGTKNPSMTAIISLAKVFNVTTDYLLGISTNQDQDEYLLSYREKTLLSNYRVLDDYGQKTVDVVCTLEKSRVIKQNNKTSDNIVSFDIQYKYIPRYIIPSAAGYSTPIDNDDFEMIPVDDNIPSDADFAVNIQGNSMYPYIKDGDTVYVKKDCELSIGDVGIFCVDGVMYCKQYYIDDERNLILVSVNPELRDTNVIVNKDSKSSVKCYGKVLLDCKINLPNYIYG